MAAALPVLPSTGLPARAAWLDDAPSKDRLVREVQLARWVSLLGVAGLGALLFLVFESGSSVFPNWGLQYWVFLAVWTVGAMVDLGIAIPVTGSLLLAIEEESEAFHLSQPTLLASILGTLLGGIVPGLLLLRVHRSFYGRPPPEPEPAPAAGGEPMTEGRPASGAPGSAPSRSSAPASPSPPVPPQAAPARPAAPVAAAPPPPPPPPASSPPIFAPTTPGPVYVPAGPPTSALMGGYGPSSAPTVVPPAPAPPPMTSQPLGPRTCPQCGNLRRSGEVSCSSCGAFFPS